MALLTKNKLINLLIVILLIANTVAIAVFFLGKPGRPMEGRRGPADFLIKELGFDQIQQKQFLQLVDKHRTSADLLRQQTKEAKDDFFDLLNKPEATEEMKLRSAKNISAYTEQLDLLTLNHFAEVRKICNPEQRKKFDSIIKEVTRMMGKHEGSGPRGINPPPEK